MPFCVMLLRSDFHFHINTFFPASLGKSRLSYSCCSALVLDKKIKENRWLNFTFCILRRFTLKVCFCWMIELNIIANLHSYLERGTKQKRAYNFNPRVDRRLRLYNMGWGRNLHSGNRKYGSVQTSISTSIPIFEKSIQGVWVQVLYVLCISKKHEQYISRDSLKQQLCIPTL